MNILQVLDDPDEDGLHMGTSSVIPPHHTFYPSSVATNHVLLISCPQAFELMTKGYAFAFFKIILDAYFKL